MGNEKKRLYKDTTDVGVERYTLKVTSIEEYSKGGDSGKMDDAPGTFLTQKVFLKDCFNPSTLESLAIEMKVVLLEESKEITHEPEEYSRLKHEQLVTYVSRHPQICLQNLKKAVKKAL